MVISAVDEKCINTFLFKSLKELTLVVRSSNTQNGGYSKHFAGSRPIMGVTSILPPITCQSYEISLNVKFELSAFPFSFN